MKHVIEPTLALEYVSGFSNQKRVPFVLSDPTDFVVGASSRVTYGLTNRLLYRSRAANGARGATREFLTIGVQQTYYTNPESSRYDPNYVTSLSRPTGVSLSPVTLTARVSPTTAFDTTTKAEYDVNGYGLQSLTSSGTMTIPNGTTSISFSHQRLSPAFPATSYVSGSTTLTKKQLRGTYSLNWDIARGYVVSQSFIGSYMAQCCGIQFDFQDYHFPANSGYPVSADRRFNFGFVLAGLGTFSNFFGAFGGFAR
jgi:hypothetical protein